MNDKYRMPIVLAYHTGMRISEIIGLDWSKVNLAEGTITVDRQLKRVRGIGYVFGTLKTQSSNRTIYLDKQLIQELSEWRKVQQANEAAAGDSYIIPYVTPEQGKVQEQSSAFALPPDAARLNLVCTSPCGNFMKHDALSWLLKKNGLNAHSFRHTHATQLIEAGAPVKDVSARLGHASVAITEDIYAKVTEKMSRNTVALFEDKVLQGNADKQIHADKLQTNS
jgi:integrase